MFPCSKPHSTTGEVPGTIITAGTPGIVSQLGFMHCMCHVAVSEVTVERESERERERATESEEVKCGFKIVF